VDPDGVAVAGDEPALGAERPAGATPARELVVPERAIVGVEPVVPEDRILEPLVLRVPEELPLPSTAMKVTAGICSTRVRKRASAALRRASGV
jgi:hypothetical protein